MTRSTSTLLPLLCLLLGACAAAPASLHLRDRYDAYAVGGDGTAAFQRGCTDRITLLRLSPAEFDQIGEVAERSGFFAWPEDLSELPHEPSRSSLDTIFVTSACAEGELSLSFHGRAHTVNWTCNTASELAQLPAEAPAQIRRLLDVIRSTFAAHAEMADVPKHGCRMQ